MDSRTPDTSMDDMAEDVEEYEEEPEVTREELVEALQGVVRNLSEGLKGPNREEYLKARDPEDELAQNDWFFAGLSDEAGQFAVTMWPAEGEEDMLRVDIGSEEDVHNLASSPEQIEALTDDFIEGMTEEYDEDYDYDDEDEDEELADEDEEYDEDEELDEEDEDYDEKDELMEEEEFEEDTLEDEETIGRDGKKPPL